MFDVAIKALCDYSDEMAAQGKVRERKAVQHCISLLNSIFYEYEDERSVVDNYETEDPVEAEILKLLGLEVCRYRNKTWYEFPVSTTGVYGNGRRADSVEEVVAYLVDRWNKNEHDMDSALVRMAVTEVLKDMEKENGAVGEKVTEEDRFYIKRVGNKLRDLMEEKLIPHVRTMRKEDL